MTFSNRDIVALNNIYYRIPLSKKLLDDASSFEIPTEGQFYLSPNSCEILKYCGQPAINSRRLIYENIIDSKVTTSASVEDIYGGHCIIPNGYKFVRFGLVKNNEIFLDRFRHVTVNMISNTGPYIVVEKI